MIISHKHRFILFHNPKTAGMSLRAVLGSYHDDPFPLAGFSKRPPFDYSLDFAHLRLWEIKAILPELIETARHYRSLVFVRDPYRRFVSAADQHLKTFFPDVPMPMLGPAEQMLIIETLIEERLRPELIRNDHRFVHFSPQSWFLQSEGLRLPGAIVPMDDHGAFVSRGFETLGLTPRPVPRDNRSRCNLSHVFTSPKIRAFVRNFYADDFAFFAADPALAHLAEERTPNRWFGPKIRGSEKAAPANLTPQPVQKTSDHADAALDPSALSAALLDAANWQHPDTPTPQDAADPMTIAADLDRAAVDMAAGRERDAFERIRCLLAKHPGHPRGLAILGQLAVIANRPVIGLASLQRAYAVDKRLEHRIWLALCLAKIGCMGDAVNVMRLGIETVPPTPNGHFAVGLVFYALGQYDEAARFYGSCASLDASRSDARHRGARALYAAGRIEPAITAYTGAIDVDSSKAEYYADLSAALSDVGRFEEARAAAQTAVELDPGSVVAHNNLGHALQNLNRSAEAVAAYQNAIDGSDSYAKARFGHALALLKCGDFERGWRQYEWRWQAGQAPRPDPGVPVWRGEDIHGQTILLHGEQGLGDTLQFVRFAPLVAARGAQVVLEVPAPLVRLLRRVDGIAQVIARGDTLPPIDWHCPMASLPLAFDLRLETIPGSPYLHRPCGGNRSLDAAPHLLPDRSLGQPDLVVGLVWAGDPRPSEPGLNLIDRRRSTRLDVLAPLLHIDGVRFMSFQFGSGRDQLFSGTWPVVDAMEGVTDFADTADRLAGIDLLISVDTSMVHLAGGMGVPVWMLSRFDGCWRWLDGRTDTPWYPSLRIFRQQSPGDWSGVVAEVGAALRDFACG